MKMTKLSLIAALAVSSAFAGGDIAPVEPAVEAPAPVSEACNANTTINGKAVLYYYTDDSVDLFDEMSSNLGAAVTIDVAHKFNDNITANIGAVGFTNLMDDAGYMEGEETGAILNIANITATFADTTLVAGRQLLDTPMLKSFDWLLAPESYEAYTLVNSSIENLTLVGSYVAKYRPINAGDNYLDLTDAGDHWTVAAAYATDAFNVSAWYYNVDIFDYTQVYVDAGTTLAGAEIAAQYAGTDYGSGDDSTAFGIKAAGEVAGIGLMAAYNNVADNYAGYVGADGLYTSSWNTFAANSVGNAFKVEASGEFSGLSTTASYAYYEYETDAEEGHEFDLILGYGFTDCVSLDAIYSNTNYGDGSGDVSALELIATYKF